MEIEEGIDGYQGNAEVMEMEMTMTGMKAIMKLMPTEVTRTFDATEDVIYTVRNQAGLWVNNVRDLDGKKGDHL